MGFKKKEKIENVCQQNQTAKGIHRNIQMKTGKKRIEKLIKNKSC